MSSSTHSGWRVSPRAANSRIYGLISRTGVPSIAFSPASSRNKFSTDRGDKSRLQYDWADSHHAERRCRLSASQVDAALCRIHTPNEREKRPQRPKRQLVPKRHSGVNCEASRSIRHLTPPHTSSTDSLKGLGTVLIGQNSSWRIIVLYRTAERKATDSGGAPAPPPTRLYLAVPKIRRHCHGCVYSGARETLEVVLTHRLHFGGCGPNAAQLRADAKPGGGLAEK